MTKKARLSDLNRQIKAVEPVEEAASAIEANPPRHERSNFLKCTVMLPPQLVSELQALGVRRRAQRLPDTTVSAILREAAVALLEKESGGGG